MLTAEASVETERPSRYIGQLCRHFNQKGRHLLGGLREHLSGDAQPRADLRARIETIRNSRIDVEWSETHGIVSFGWGQCTMQAGPDTLTLRAQAADEETCCGSRTSSPGTSPVRQTRPSHGELATAISAQRSARRRPLAGDWRGRQARPPL
jgi:hypothetical protein